MNRLLQTATDGYLGRLATYVSAAAIGSFVGATFTWLNNNWVNADPVTGLWLVPFSLGPALVVAAVARCTPRAATVMAATAGLAMLVMWWVFANSGSSTAVLVFFWGWFAGIPAALAFVAFYGRPDSPIRSA